MHANKPSVDQSPRRQMIVDLLRAGYKVTSIAAALRVSTKTVCQVSRACGLTQRRRWLTDGERKILQQLLGKGNLKQVEIARRLDVHRSTVSRHAARLVRAEGDPRPCRPKRCPQCGTHVVLWPCQVCRAAGR